MDMFGSLAASTVRCGSGRVCRPLFHASGHSGTFADRLRGRPIPSTAAACASPHLPRGSPLSPTGWPSPPVAGSLRRQPRNTRLAPPAKKQRARGEAPPQLTPRVGGPRPRHRRLLQQSGSKVGGGDAVSPAFFSCPDLRKELRRNTVASSSLGAWYPTTANCPVYLGSWNCLCKRTCIAVLILLSRLELLEILFGTSNWNAR